MPAQTTKTGVKGALSKMFNKKPAAWKKPTKAELEREQADVDSVLKRLEKERKGREHEEQVFRANPHAFSGQFNKAPPAPAAPRRPEKVP